jgi:hypothetical protein
MGAGYNSNTNLKKIFIIRAPKDPGEKVQVIVCNAQEVLRHGDIRENVYVKSGDTVFLARGILATVSEFQNQVDNIAQIGWSYSWAGMFQSVIGQVGGGATGNNGTNNNQ